MDATIMNMYATQTGLGLGNHSMLPLSGTTTASETFFPPPHFSSLLHKPAVLESDNSTLSHNNVVPVSRKRSRDSIHDNNFPFHSYPQKKTDSFSFLGEDISSHIHRQQLDLDALVSQHVILLPFSDFIEISFFFSYTNHPFVITFPSFFIWVLFNQSPFSSPQLLLRICQTQGSQCFSQKLTVQNTTFLIHQ